MQSRRLTHTVLRIERVCRGCWVISTQTEDGHRFTAFGVARQQAVYRAHCKAKAYGRYAYPTAAAHERSNVVAHRIMTFVQDGSRAYHQPCAASVALSRTAMFCDVWSGESLPPDLCCAACGRAIARPLPASLDTAEHASGTSRHAGRAHSRREDRRALST
jgi:hypothetical protein